MLEIPKEHPHKLLHRAVAKAVIGAAFSVHDELGFLERVYQRALQVELSRRGLSAEIKVNPQYDKRDEAQLLNELKATGLKLACS